MASDTAGTAPRAGIRLGGATVAGGIAFGILALNGAPLIGLLCGIAVLGIVFIGWSHRVLFGMDAEETRRNVLREDLNPRVDHLLVVLLSLAALAGIVIVLVIGRSQAREIAAAIALVAVFADWAVLHVTYAARYGRLYYLGKDGGIDFNTEQPPCFADFYYFSFNLGMTYQVSDTNVTSARIRRVVLGHCLLSYIFGTVVLAATINLVAGIATGS